jgi:hypothetical protein
MNYKDLYLYVNMKHLHNSLAVLQFSRRRGMGLWMWYYTKSRNTVGHGREVNITRERTRMKNITRS